MAKATTEVVRLHIVTHS